MSSPIEIVFGPETWQVDLPAEKRLAAERSDRVPSTASAGDQVRAALEKPFDFEPLRRALTPDDHVVVVVDESLPALAEIVAAVLQHLASAGIPLDAVTLLSPTASGSWIDDLPDELADVRTEVHDSADRKRIAYLATSKGGRRIYLNRTLVEAEFVVVVSGRRYDPHGGYAGGESLVFPALSDDESRTAFAADGDAGEPAEVAWLLGTPFFVQVIDDGERVLDVVAGLPGSTSEGVRRQDAFWGVRVAERPDTLVTSVATRATFADVAAAAYQGSRVVEKGGRVVVLAPPVDLGGDGVGILRQADDPKQAYKLLKERPNDPARLWAAAAARCRLYVANINDDAAEELFATHVGNDRELQRLLEPSERVLVVPNGHRARVELTERESP